MIGKKRWIENFINSLNKQKDINLSLYHESNLYTLRINENRIGQTMHSLQEVENSLFLITDLLREVVRNEN